MTMIKYWVIQVEKKMRELSLRNWKLNQQCDKMSKLEFVAIQFGVKFTIMYKVRHYVDRICQSYLHYFMLFRKICYLYKVFHDLTFIFLFSRSSYILPYMDL